MARPRFQNRAGQAFPLRGQHEDVERFQQRRDITAPTKQGDPPLKSSLLESSPRCAVKLAVPDQNTVRRGHPLAHQRGATRIKIFGRFFAVSGTRPSPRADPLRTHPSVALRRSRPPTRSGTENARINAGPDHRHLGGRKQSPFKPLTAISLQTAIQWWSRARPSIQARSAVAEAKTAGGVTPYPCIVQNTGNTGQPGSDAP